MPFNRYPLRHRPLLALLPLAICLPLLSTGCATLSTRESRARTERPTLPARPSELTKTERLKPLIGDQSGNLVTIDRGELAELYSRLGEAVGAVERGNNRIGGWNKLWICIDAIWRTGKTPKGCEAPPARKGED